MNDANTTQQKKPRNTLIKISLLPLEFIEKEKFVKYSFVFICIVMAVGTLVYPFIILGRVISSGYFNFGSKYVLAFILIWLSILAACWFGFILWLKKWEKAKEIGSSEFVVIPFFSEILKTFGEWLGVLFFTIGVLGGLFALLFFGKNSGGLLSVILFGVNGNAGGILTGIPLIGGIISSAVSFALNNAIIFGPVTGYLIIIVTRFFAEQLRVIAAIANNTKDLSGNNKQGR